MARLTRTPSAVEYSEKSPASAAARAEPRFDMSAAGIAPEPNAHPARTRIATWAAAHAEPLASIGGALLLAALQWFPAFRDPAATGFGDWQMIHHNWEAAYVALARFGEWPLWDPFHCGGVSILGNPDVPQFDQINSVDGVGGVAARGFARIGAGNAYLDDKRVVLLTVGIDEMLQPSQINTPSYAFTGGYVSVRVDVPRSVMATFEGGFGGNFGRHDTLRNIDDSTTRAWIGANIRKIFSTCFWLGGAVSYEALSDHIVYQPRGTTFDTSEAPRFSISLYVGIPLGGQR